MTAEDPPSNGTEAPEGTAEQAATATPEAPVEAAAPDTADAPPEEAAAKPAPEVEEKPEPEPVPDPGTCKAIAIGLDAFWKGVLDGEWDDTDLEYYLEPAGVLNGPLVCTRAADNDPQRAGLLMTRAGWRAKTLFLDDGVNPETYELSFPKEFGYVKTLTHYKPDTREHAKFPWSKKY
jgi:hypothetical protein